jgi:hypothetical protein
VKKKFFGTYVAVTGKMVYEIDNWVTIAKPTFTAVLHPVAAG